MQRRWPFLALKAVIFLRVNFMGPHNLYVKDCYDHSYRRFQKVYLLALLNKGCVLKRSSYDRIVTPRRLNPNSQEPVSHLKGFLP